MNKNAERARELVPSIILTVLSMIQALALEFYWTRLGESTFLWNGGWDAVLGWLQVFCVLGGILLVWLFYVSIVLRFTWMPALEDMLFPFFIGLLEFGSIEVMHPDTIGIWLLLIACILGVAVATGHLTLRRARKEPSNDYFFRNVEPATWRSFSQTITIGSALALCGLLLIFFDSHWLALFGLVLTVVSFTYQFQQAREYWLHSVLDDSEESTN